MANHNLKTLSEVLTILVKRGITKEIRMNDRHQLVLEDGEKTYEPEDLRIVKSYRFEGDSSPEDSAVLYVLEDTEGEFSTLLDSYGAESNFSGEEFDNFLRAIPIEENPEFDFQLKTKKPVPN